MTVRPLGMSSHHWRTTLPIHHAQRTSSTGMSVTDTAMACGWSNPTSLIKAFTEIAGRTPTGCQKSAQRR